MTNKMARLFPEIFPSQFFSNFEKLFSDLDFYDPTLQNWQMRGFPRGDILTSENETVIELALAGYSKEQISVRAEDRNIIVSAKKCDETVNESRSLARRAFEQEFFFNKDFDLSTTSVTFKDGLLRVVVPKMKPENKIIKDFEIK